jgi:beta-glucosidase
MKLKAPGRGLFFQLFIKESAYPLFKKVLGEVIRDQKTVNMKTPAVTFLLFITLFSCADKNSNTPDYLNTKLSFEVRTLDLISRMTTEEKISQMIHDAPPIERLGIPNYDWMNECLHGVANMEDFVTVFPQSIGMGASFDRECMYRVAMAISDEARAMHHNDYRNKEGGHVGGLTFWSPNINLFRDPRWGRGQESYGEDPYHIGQMTIPFIKGLQGIDPKYLKLVSTVKHYVVHSGPEPERHEFDAKTSERDFWETYMPHFITAIEEADVYSCCGSNYLLNEMLREKFNFSGYIVSDCGSVADIYEGHQIKTSLAEAAALALSSGVDLNCHRHRNCPFEHLKKALDEGLIHKREIDTAVYRLMLARMKLGMFDPPEMVPYSKIPKEVIDCEKHHELALEMARKSIVLLKNARLPGSDDNTLPLNKSIKRIAVIGPNAMNENVLLGNYHGTPSNPISLLTGIMNKLPSAQILYSKGCDYVNEPDLLNILPPSVLYTNDNNNQKGIKVQFFNNKSFSGSPVVEKVESIVFLTSEFGTPYKSLEDKNFSVRWLGNILIPESAKYKLITDGNENCKVYIDNKLVIDGTKKNSSEFIDFEGGEFYEIKIELVADIEEFDLSMFWKIDQDDLTRNAIAAAKESDAVIMAMGISTEIEGEELPVELKGFNGGDRTTIELPVNQQNLIRDIKAMNKPVILVLMGGGSFELPEEHNICDAIIEAWYPGQEGGTAIADVLFGDYNPGGKLPLTFYKSTSDMPDFRNYDMEGRTYRFFKGEPLYAFGHGLSYTTFEYSNLQVPETISVDEKMEISVDVKNTGLADGDEVIQLYVKDLEASVRVPVQSLQGFERVHLESGETKTLKFTLEPEQLALLNNDMQWIIEEGDFQISVGGRQPELNERSGKEIQVAIIEVENP